MKATTIPVVGGAMGLIKKVWRNIYNRSWVTSNSGTTADHTTWNIPHSKRGTLHQINSYLILTLGTRNGLGYCILLTHSGLQSSKHGCNLLPACPTIIIFYLLVTTSMCTRDDEE